MNTANKITMIRVVLVPIFMVLFMIDNVMCHYAALGVFVLASITDAIDGHVARKYNQVTTFGKFVDPLADKVLTTAAFLILMYYDRMSVWALMIVLVREFAVAGIRLVAAGEGKVHKLLCMGNKDSIDTLAIKLRRKFPNVYICRSKDTYLEINHPMASKANAMRFLCDYMGISLSQTVAFGDGEVDLEMIQLAGMGFAMQNAPDKVKKRVKHIAKSNDDEGILTTLITMGF